MRGVQPAQKRKSRSVSRRTDYRIGQEAVEEIESNHNRYRWTVEEC
ncbi:putative ninG protein, partial [Escherichia coli 99.0713]